MVYGDATHDEEGLEALRRHSFSVKGTMVQVTGQNAGFLLARCTCKNTPLNTAMIEDSMSS